MKKMTSAVVLVALAVAPFGCAASNESEVELKATVKNSKLSGQWEVQSAEGSKGGRFGGKPKTIKVGSFGNLESVYASAQREGGSHMSPKKITQERMSSKKLTLELIIDGETVDQASTTDSDAQAIVEYPAE
jgi:hypothetical protein